MHTLTHHHTCVCVFVCVTVLHVCEHKCVCMQHFTAQRTQTCVCMYVCVRVRSIMSLHIVFVSSFCLFLFSFHLFSITNLPLIFFPIALMSDRGP